MPAAANSPVTRTAMAAAGGDLPRRVTVASNAAPAATAIDNAAYLSSFPDSRSVTPVAAASQTRLGAARADLPLAVPGRRTHAADFAGGAGIVGQQFVADLGCASNPGCLAARFRDISPKSAHPAGSISSATATAPSARAAVNLYIRSSRRTPLWCAFRHLKLDIALRSEKGPFADVGMRGHAVGPNIRISRMSTRPSRRGKPSTPMPLEI